MSCRVCRLTAFFFTLLVLACAGPRKETAPPVAQGAGELGKVHVQYQYTGADRLNPPISFHVWRSDAPGGPFALVNQQPVPAEADAPTGEIQHILTDYGLNLNQSYYYYVERVDGKGRISKAGPVTEAVVTLPLTKDDRAQLERTRAQEARRRQQGKRPGQLTSREQ